MAAFATPAVAAPNSGASCQAILSSTDAQAQDRDDVAQFFAHDLKDAFGVAPGAVYSDVSQNHDGSYAACAPTS